MLRRALKYFEYRFGPAIHGNTLGLEFNRNWAKYHKDCRKSISSNQLHTDDHLLKARELSKDRLSVLTQVDTEQLSKLVSDYFGDSNQVYSEMPPELSVQYTDMLFKILKQAEPYVTAYYGSYFQPYYMLIQRTTPGKTTAASSFGWHIDDNPKELMKLFVYLNDVSESNGAFRAFPWSFSRKILMKGFRSNGESTRVNAQPLADNFLSKNPGALKILEGSKGTILAFDNNLVHKGTAPRIGYRHAIQIPIYPSLVPLNKEMVRRALSSSRSHDYPRNPYINDYGNSN
jgi:hypothetical protein